MSEHEVNDRLDQIAKENQSKCDHGVVFDEVAAKKVMEETPVDPSIDQAVSFILGSPAHYIIRKRWPRLDGTCPKGCGFYGIAYASYAHYIYGDW